MWLYSIWSVHHVMMITKNHYHNCGFFHGFETFDRNGNDDGNAATLIKIGLNIGAFLLFELISCFIWDLFYFQGAWILVKSLWVDLNSQDWIYLVKGIFEAWLRSRRWINSLKLLIAIQTDVGTMRMGKEIDIFVKKRTIWPSYLYFR